MEIAEKIVEKIYFNFENNQNNSETYKIFKYFGFRKIDSNEKYITMSFDFKI